MKAEPHTALLIPEKARSQLGDSRTRELANWPQAFAGVTTVLSFGGTPCAPPT